MWSYFSTQPALHAFSKVRHHTSHNALFSIESFAICCSARNFRWSQQALLEQFLTDIAATIWNNLMHFFSRFRFFLLGYIEQKLATNVALLSLFYIKVHSQEMHNDRKSWFKNDEKIISITLIFWLHDYHLQANPFFAIWSFRIKIVRVLFVLYWTLPITFTYFNT